MTQLSEIQVKKFCININGTDCIFMPMELFVADQFLPLGKKVKGSTLGWYVKRKFVSYNQVKKLIKKSITGETHKRKTYEKTAGTITRMGKSINLSSFGRIGNFTKKT